MKALHLHCFHFSYAAAGVKSCTYWQMLFHPKLLLKLFEIQLFEVAIRSLNVHFDCLIHVAFEFTVTFISKHFFSVKPEKRMQKMSGLDSSKTY